MRGLLLLLPIAILSVVCMILCAPAVASMNCQDYTQAIADTTAQSPETTPAQVRDGLDPGSCGGTFDASIVNSENYTIACGIIRVKIRQGVRLLCFRAFHRCC